MHMPLSHKVDYQIIQPEYKNESYVSIQYSQILINTNGLVTMNQKHSEKLQKILNIFPG